MTHDFEKQWLMIDVDPTGLLASRKLEDSPFADFGTKRIADELMCIPGRVEFMDGKLHKVALLETHPCADDMRLVLEELLDFFEDP